MEPKKHVFRLHNSITPSLYTNMNSGKYPRSVAKHIRTEKARIRKDVENIEERGRLIKEVVNKFEAHART